MSAIIRIPIAGSDCPGRVDDLDIFQLLWEAGAGPSTGSVQVAALGSNGECLPAQWIEAGRPSAVPGHQRGSLLFDRNADCLLVADGAQGNAKEEVRIAKTPDVLQVEVQGQRYFDYHYNTKAPETPRPYFHPLIGPGGKPITQMGEVPGKRVKHFHHTALWISHQNFTPKGMDKCNNWQMNKNCTRIDHVEFDSVESGPMAARFVEKLNWLDRTGKIPVLVETRTVTVPRRPANKRVIDIEIVLKGQKVPVTWNRTPYHLLACRVLDAMLPGKGGLMTNSAGDKNPKTGTPAKWIDVSGNLDGKPQGVALFDHPKNTRHPTPCLQFAKQTIGLSPSHREPLTIEPGQEVKFRYRVLVHAGDAKTGKVAEEYEEFVKTSQARLGRPEVIEL